jgi:transposase
MFLARQASSQKKAAMVTNDSRVTACGLFRKTAKAYAGKTVFAIPGNARYQKCSVTGELAEQPGLNLVFIPPYSPNLSLIERFWKFVKGKPRSRHYDQSELFRGQIDSIINSADNHSKEIAGRLIGEKVQLFDELIAINENSFMRGKEAA